MARGYKGRIDTILTLLNGSPVTRSFAEFNAIISEYNNVDLCKRIQNANRKHLLMVLHSARGLDTTLKSFLDHYGIRQGDSCGRYLGNLENHTNRSIGMISHLEKLHFQASIVRIRNRYMHEAGAYPLSRNDVFQLLGEMDALLTRVLSL